MLLIHLYIIIIIIIMIYPPHLRNAATLPRETLIVVLGSAPLSEDRAPSVRNSEIYYPDFWPPNSPDHSPVECGIWSMTQAHVCIRGQFETWLIWGSTWLTHDIACRTAVWTMLLTNGGGDFRSAWMKNEDILNTCCSITELELGLVVHAY